MASTRCWCGKSTTVWTSPDVGVTDTAHSVYRICPEHGENWQKRPEETPAEG